jgi:LacI family transcriptional regulator
LTGTIEEIAKIAKVSRSTVSRVLNGDPNVREKTRQHVLEVLRTTGFQPNRAARRLAGGHARIIGLIIPSGVARLFSDPFFAILIQHISHACSARDQAVMLWLAEPEYERRMIGQLLGSGLVDGVLVASSVIDDPLVEALHHSPLPLVMIGRSPHRTEISSIDVDNIESARRAVHYLLERGRGRIAVVNGPQNMISGLDRFEGYKTALQDWGLELDPALVVPGEFSEEDAFRGMEALLQREQVQAVFAASDSMALGAMRAIQKAGLRIPEDVALVGFDDLPLASRTDPPLTTMRQPIPGLAVTAVETLIQQINHPETGPKQIVLPAELVIRGTG